MVRIVDKPGQKRAVYKGLAGLVGALALFGLVGLLRVFDGLALLPAAALLATILALSVWGFIKAHRMDLSPSVLLEADARGVSILGRAHVPWEEIEAVIHRNQTVGYGPMDTIGVRRKFTPNGTAATWAERTVRNVLSDRSFAPSAAAMLPKDILTELDAEMAKAGYRRGQKAYKERGAYRTWTWALEPMKESDQPQV